MRGWTRIKYVLPESVPLVSVIVPSRDAASLLTECADGVLRRTDYDPLELIIIDNDSMHPAALRLLDKLATDTRVKIVRHNGAFNFARMINRGVELARGDVVVLLNNDIEISSPVWLEELVSHALRPKVGAVGAKLTYPNGRIQHAGVVLGPGHGAGHAFHGAPGNEGGYFGLLGLTREVTAVTAACLAMRRDVFVEVGGMDALSFPVAFNDVDLCLRLRARGYSIVYAPGAELIHHESATRGADVDPAKRRRREGEGARLRARWGDWIDKDPFYNPNCSIETADFAIASVSRRSRPWHTIVDRHSGSLSGV